MPAASVVGTERGTGDREHSPWMRTCPQFSHLRLSSTTTLPNQPSPFVLLVPENHFLKFPRKTISPLPPRWGGTRSHAKWGPGRLSAPCRMPTAPPPSPRLPHGPAVPFLVLLFESRRFLRSDRSAMTCLFTFHLPGDRGAASLTLTTHPFVSLCPCGIFPF